MSSNQIYCKVVNGLITDYPVTMQLITARGDPLSIYTPVLESSKPLASPYQNINGQPVILGSQVVMQYTVVNKTLEQLLALAWGVSNSYILTTNIASTLTPPDVNTLDPGLVAAVENQITSRVQNLLNLFAQQKGYDTIDSLIGYVSSSVPSFSQEAKIGINLRDQTWSALYTFLAKVQSGTVPIIKTFAEIQAAIPPMSWTPVVNGPGSVAADSISTFTIANYDSNITYTFTNVAGAVMQQGNTVTYTASGAPGNGGFTINGIVVFVKITAAQTVSLSGLLNASVSAMETYTIANYASSTNYTASATSGSVSVTGNSILFSTPATSGQVTLSVNNTSFNLGITSGAVTPAISGLLQVPAGSIQTYDITDYNSATTYSAAAASGSASVSGSVIIYTAPSITGMAGFTVNGIVYPILVI